MKTDKKISLNSLLRELDIYQKQLVRKTKSERELSHQRYMIAGCKMIARALAGEYPKEKLDKNFIRRNKTSLRFNKKTNRFEIKNPHP